jgi:hypothetical protein
MRRIFLVSLLIPALSVAGDVIYPNTGKSVVYGPDGGPVQTTPAPCSTLKNWYFTFSDLDASVVPADGGLSGQTPSVSGGIGMQLGVGDCWNEIPIGSTSTLACAPDTIGAKAAALECK